MSAPETFTPIHDSGMVAVPKGEWVHLSDYLTLRAERDALAARVERLEGALRFYADKEAWTQPPVRTRDGLLTVEYENQASKMQRDRGAIARAALSTAQEG
jgi:hypothetical protein